MPAGPDCCGHALSIHPDLLLLLAGSEAGGDWIGGCNGLLGGWVLES